MGKVKRDAYEASTRRRKGWGTLNSTIDYYEKNASTFAESTVNVEFTKTQDRFLSCLEKGAHILDFGCGSGRDTRYFLQRGFAVDAIDGSEELCRYASAMTGIRVRHMLFQELEEQNVYDGIWACASILHLPKAELKVVMRKMTDALRENGILYTSFKNSLFEGERNGRYFTDFTIETFSSFLKETEGIILKEYWVSNDARPDRSDEKWLNLILQKM